MDNKLLELVNNRNKHLIDMIQLMQMVAGVKYELDSLQTRIERNELEEQKKQISRHAWHLESEIFLSQSQQ